MRLGARVVLTIIVLAGLGVASGSCGGGGPLFRQYEYEEELYLSLDGTATLYVNSSVPALDALRGASFDPAPNARLDRNAVRAFFTTPLTRVTRVSTSRRNNRRFVHVRIDLDDVTRLGGAAPFAWSAYRFERQADRFVFQQTVGAPAPANPFGAASGSTAAARAGWTGDELVAFRLHLPSTLLEHNAGEQHHRRGNILEWEQLLSERLAGRPLVLEAQMETESILARTLWLFIGTASAVALAFGLIIWAIVRRGRSPSPSASAR